MKLFRYIKGILHTHKAKGQRRALLSRETIPSVSPDDFSSSLKDPLSYYERAFQDFHRVVPEKLREHRKFFQAENRGFGEDAFHTMWWRLVRHFKPESFLEIGVYRGQVVSLIALNAKLEGIHCDVTGISPFNSSGDSVSQYRNDVNYLEDTLSHFRHFGLQKPVLVSAFSTDPEALEVIASRRWDMIYIDGNHDYNVVVKDWDACSKAIKPGGIIILDDSGLTTTYHPPAFSTAGHPGPSRLASEIDPKHFKEILQVGHNRVFQHIN